MRQSEKINMNNYYEEWMEMNYVLFFLFHLSVFIFFWRIDYLFFVTTTTILITREKKFENQRILCNVVVTFLLLLLLPFFLYFMMNCVVLPGNFHHFFSAQALTLEMYVCINHLNQLLDDEFSTHTHIDRERMI